MLLLAIIVLRRRKTKPKEVTVVDEEKGPVTFSNPMLLSPEFRSITMQKEPEFNSIMTEVNPLFEEPVVLEPDNIHDEEALVFVFKTMCEHTEGTFEQLVEHVKGTPLFGKMMKMSDDKKEHFVKVLQMTEVERVMSKLRRVNRASLDKSSTLVKQMRVQARWHSMVKKCVNINEYD
jgi:hypothetical protein